MLVLESERVKYMIETERVRDHVTSSLTKAQHTVGTACSHCVQVTDCDRLKVVGVVLEEERDVKRGFILCNVYNVLNRL